MATPHHERMSSVDTAWLRMDSPLNSMMIVGVSATETPIRPADFRRMAEERLLCFPRFRHKAVADPVGASWVLDDEFDLDEHIEVLNLPAPAGRTELEALAAELASTPLDPRRPMWQLHLVANYLDGSAWITRVHHCYADGIAMVRVLLSMTGQDPGPSLAGHATTGRAKTRPKSTSTRANVLPLPGWAQHLAQPAGDMLERALTEGARLLESGIHEVFHPDRAASLATHFGGMVGEFARVFTLPDDPDTPLRGALSGYKGVAWADSIPLEDVRTVGKALGCTINDVLMCTVAGALGSYLRDRGFDTTDLVLRANVPVNLRAADEPLTLGNKFGLIFVDLPLGIRDPLKRLYAVHDTLKALKGSLQPPMTLMLLGLMGLMPQAVQAPTIELLSRKVSAVVSNVPGPQEPLYMCGQRVTEMYFWVPQSGVVGLGISILSYDRRVLFGVISDRKLVRRPHEVVDRFVPEFEKLLLAATVGALATRKSPNKSRQTPNSARRPTRSRRRKA